MRLSYETWKWFKDLVDEYVITGGGDILAAASQIELPFIGPLLVKAAAGLIGYGVDELLDMIPHKGPNEPDYIDPETDAVVIPRVNGIDDFDFDNEKLKPKIPVNSKEMMDIVINKKGIPLTPLLPSMKPVGAPLTIQAPFGSGEHINTEARDVHLPIIEQREKIRAKKIEPMTQPFVNVGGPFVGYTQPGFNPNRAQRMFNHDMLLERINKYPSGQGAGLHVL